MEDNWISLIVYIAEQVTKARIAVFKHAKICNQLQLGKWSQRKILALGENSFILKQTIISVIHVLSLASFALYNYQYFVAAE